MNQNKEDQTTPFARDANKKGKEEITSDAIKNAHASGDGTMGRNESSIPEKEEVSQKEELQRRAREQY